MSAIHIPPLSIALIVLSGACQAMSPQQIFAKFAATVTVLQTEDASGQRLGSYSTIRIGKGQYVASCDVLDNAAGVRIATGGELVETRIVARDRPRNLCLASTKEANEANDIEVQIQSVSPPVGSRVYAIANTAGLGMGITEGVVSGIRQLPAGTYLQFSAAISPGASGGALFDDGGKLLGVIDYRRRDGQNVNFAIAATAIAEVTTRAAASKAQLERFEQAQSLLLKANWTELEALALAWGATEPDNPDAWGFVARAATELKHSDTELSARQTLRRIQPNSADFATQLGDALLARNMNDAALALSRQLAIDHPEDARVHWLLARALHASGQLKDANAAYRKAVILDPWLLGAYQGLATLAQAQGDTATAIAIWLRLSGLYPEALAPRRGLIQAYLSSGKAARAYAVLEELPEPERASALGWYWRGAVLAGLGCPEQAVAAYRKSLDIGFTDADWVWAGIAAAMVEMGRRPEAIQAYQAASAANPTKHEWRYLLAVQLKGGGRPGEALKITEDLVKRYPEEAHHWRQHGFVLAVLGRPMEAIPAMEHSLQIDPRQAKLWAALVETYQVAGRRKDALEAYRRLRELDSKRADEAYRDHLLPYEEDRR